MFPAISTPSARQTLCQELLAPLAALAARLLGAAEELRQVRVAVTVGVLDIGLQTQRIAERLLGEPDQVVVLVLSASCLASFVGHFFFFSSSTSCRPCGLPLASGTGCRHCPSRCSGCSGSSPGRYRSSSRPSKSRSKCSRSSRPAPCSCPSSGPRTACRP